MQYMYIDRQYFVNASVNLDEVHGFGLSCRSAIEGFSASSGKRMSRFLRNSVASYRSIGTLTYPTYLKDKLLSDPRLAKRHLRSLILRMHRRFKFVPQFSVFWFLEFTSAGIPHFHFFLNHWLPHRWLARAWYEIVGTGDPKHLSAGTSIEGIRGGRAGITGYARKYAAKQSQKQPPCSGWGRFWGVSGDSKTVARVTRFDPLQAYGSSLPSREKVQAMQEKITQIIRSGVDSGLVIQKSEPAYTYYIKKSREFWQMLNKLLAEYSVLVRLCYVEHIRYMNARLKDDLFYKQIPRGEQYVL